MPNSERIVVAMTGASGVQYGLNLLKHLSFMGVGVDLVISEAAAVVLKAEHAPGTWISNKKAHLADFGLADSDVRVYAYDNIAAPIASGSALRRGMVIVPCSMGTLGRIAAGLSGNLIERSADVCLKERRPLVIAWRETPLSLIHLRNMTTLAEAGAAMLPCAPGFYGKPHAIDDLLDQISGKVLDLLQIQHAIAPRWGGDA